MPIRALLFDLDDTLLETYPAHRAAVRRACNRAAASHPGHSAEELERSFLQAYRDLDAKVEMGSLQFATVMLFRTRAWEETLNSLDLPRELGEELANVYREERSRRYRLYEEVPGLLERLAPVYRLALVTNGPSDLQREKVAAVGLERWIPEILISGEVGSWKPHPDIFRRALERSGTAAAESLMIGDSLERDIRGAQDLGIRTLWVRRYEHLSPIGGLTPDRMVPDLRSLERDLASWD